VIQVKSDPGVVTDNAVEGVIPVRSDPGVVTNSEVDG